MGDPWSGHGWADCYRCAQERGEVFRVGRTLLPTRMFLCATCGNKRCPAATDHRLACTGSNAPKQEGSRYR